MKAQQALAAALNGKTVTVKIKMGENGKVFGSVTSQHVAIALSEMGFDVDKKKIRMDALKALGSTKAEIRLMENVSATITVTAEAL